jgi:hypothetical protein
MFSPLRCGARLPILASVLALGVWAVPGSPAFAHGHGGGGHRGGVWRGGYHHGGYYHGGNGYRFGGAYPSGYRGYGYGNGYMYPNYNSGYMYPNNGFVAPNVGYGYPQGFAPGGPAPGMIPGPGAIPQY